MSINLNGQQLPKNESAHVSFPLSFLRVFTALICAVVVSACGGSNAPTGGINDPNEAANRRIHEFNKKVDKMLLSPAASGYGSIIPAGVRNGVVNFGDHLSLPNDVINNTLQGKLPEAGSSAVRFVFNTILGLAGFVDVASDYGLERHDTDFGETLHSWGVGEGAYTEIPFFGPSTTRDAYGLAIDIFLDPFFVITEEPATYIGGITYVINAMGARHDYEATVESILYDSADSYAQARILYLQNRRHRLGMSGESTYVDPEFDPYEDPYADF